MKAYCFFKGKTDACVECDISFANDSLGKTDKI